jgi:hypothetical protein
LHLAGPSFFAGLAVAVESAQGLTVSLDSEPYAVFKLTVVSCVTIGNTPIERSLSSRIVPHSRRLGIWVSACIHREV